MANIRSRLPWAVPRSSCGMLAGTGLEMPLWLEFLLFSVMSVGTLLLFRGSLLDRMHRRPAGAPVDSLVGETATCLDDAPAGGLGKVKLRGTTWTARNDGGTTLRRGERARVVRVEGLTLWIRAESASGVARTRA